MSTAIIEAPTEPNVELLQSAKPIAQEYAALTTELERLKSTALTLEVKEVTDVNGMKLARATRLALRDVRIAVDKRREELKEDVLKRGRAIDAAAKEIISAITPLEARLLEQEKFIERLQQAERARLQAEREAKLRELGVESLITPSLGTITEVEWGIVLRDAEIIRQARAAEAARVEAERIAAEKAAEEERLRKERELAEAKAKAEEERKAREAAEAAAKAERERLEAEARAERERLEAEAAAERKRLEEAARAQREAAEKAAAEERARQEAEKAKLRAQLEAERKAAAEKAAAERAAREAAEAEAAKARAAAAEEAARKAEEERLAREEEARKLRAPDADRIRRFASDVRDLTPYVNDNALREKVNAAVKQFAAYLEKLAQ